MSRLIDNNFLQMYNKKVFFYKLHLFSVGSNTVKTTAVFVTSVLHLAGRVVADDLLVQTDADHQQLADGGEGEAGARGLVGALEHVKLLLGVGVPQDHGAAVRDAAQQGALQRGQPQVVDRLRTKHEFLKMFSGMF